jgi:hypothetical protein
MRYYAWPISVFFVGFALNACFKAATNELESMTETVIKKHEGIDIKVMPIDVPKAP